MYVKPAPGLSIRDPDLKDLLPASGRSVPDTDYWLRRVRDKDVSEAEAPVEDESPASAPATNEEGEQ